MKQQNHEEIKILYRDNHLIAVEKPIHLLVHPYRKESNERVHLMGLVRDQVGQYLFPVHRLDRPVSGIVLFGLNSEVVPKLQAVWKDETTIKEYLTLAKGQIQEAGSFSFSLFDEWKRPQEALTLYEPLEIFEECTLMKVQIRTGRRHQIRRHFSRRCHNILGDKKYGQGKINRQFQEQFKLHRIFLHAHYFKILHPVQKTPLEVLSPLPQDLEKCLKCLRQTNTTVRSFFAATKISFRSL